MRIGVINSYYYGNSQKKKQSFQGPQNGAIKTVKAVTTEAIYMTASEYRKALDLALKTGDYSIVKRASVTNRIPTK